MLWFRDYAEFYEEGPNFFEVLFGEVDPQDASSGHSGVGPIDGHKLDRFFESPLYRHWLGFVRMAPDK